MRRYPHLYEVNACLFIRRLSRKHGRALTLATVPEEEWQVFTRRGFDLVWLMGIWQRSPGARQEALLHEGLRREYDRVLPGWTDEDIAGSPYAIFGYEVNPSLGKPGELGRHPGSPEIGELSHPGLLGNRHDEAGFPDLEVQEVHNPDSPFCHHVMAGNPEIRDPRCHVLRDVGRPRVQDLDLRVPGLGDEPPLIAFGGMEAALPDDLPDRPRDPPLVRDRQADAVRRS